ncbi:hypothetical protein BC827DRAFT_1352797 [Russula dissimulans]|nr:hypothetical protein BC827DRAFT_1352797 [Russula dissimulans]
MRDNRRCVVTGIFDMNAPTISRRNSTSHKKADNSQSARILFQIMRNSRADVQLDYSASVLLAVLHRFNRDIRSFNGEKVHFLINVITLEKGIHDTFDSDRLGFYLEATVIFYRFKVHPQMCQFVTFSTTDAEHLPVPSRELLALHATCCKVAHFSGAAEYIDRTYLDEEETGVLASDGTSSDMLTYALLALSNDAVSVQGRKCVSANDSGSTLLRASLFSVYLDITK